MADQRPADDGTIHGEDRLYIRFRATDDSVVPLPGGVSRPMTGALLPRRKDEPISADLASVCTPGETRDRGGAVGPFHVAVVTVATARALGFRVTRDPILAGQDGGPNPAHVLLHGTQLAVDGNMKGAVKRREAELLARESRVADLPPTP